MLQDIFYIAVITLTVLTIVVLSVFLFIMIKTYRMVVQTIRQAQEKAAEVSDTINELGERGSSLLEMFTVKGTKAAVATGVITGLINAYLFFRSILGRRKR